VSPFDDAGVIDLTDERHDALELTAARAAYRGVLDVLSVATFAAIDEFLA
jgi:hypothetical protein